MAEKNLNDIWRILQDYPSVNNNEISGEFICTICKKILINACHGPCGCRYCLECITGYLNGSERFCPADMDDCKEEMMNISRNIHADQSINIRISRLIVKCPETSCEYKGQLRKIGDHMRVCKEKASVCPYFAIGCKDVKLVHNKMCDHLQLEIYSHAMLLIESMNHWNNEMESMTRDVADLRKEIICMKQEKTTVKGERNEAVTSEFEAQNNMQALDIDHLNRDMVAVGNVNRSMQEKIDALTLARDGDRTIINELRGQIEQQHLKMEHLGQKFERTENKFEEIDRVAENTRVNMRARIDEMLQKNHSAKIEKIIVKKSTDNVKKSTMNVKKTAENVKKSTENVKKSTENVKKSTENVMKTPENVKKSTENVMQTIEKTVQDKSSDIEDCSKKSFTSKYTWKISQWSEKVKNARDGFNRVIYSDHFYSHKNGYKMCLRLDPAGYLGFFEVYWFLMRGPFDNDLEWPFKHDVTVGILDEQTGLACRSDTLKFNDCPHNAHWTKPENQNNNPFQFLVDFQNNIFENNEQLSLQCVLHFE